MSNNGMNGALTSNGLLGYLKTYAGRNGGKMPPVREIAEHFGVGHSKTQDCINELVEA